MGLRDLFLGSDGRTESGSNGGQCPGSGRSDGRETIFGNVVCPECDEHLPPVDRRPLF